MDDCNIRNIMRVIEKDPDHNVHKLLEFAQSSGDISDPWYTGNFDRTYGEVVKGCRGLLKKLVEEKREAMV